MFDAASGKVSGTPEQEAGSCDYIVTANLQDGVETQAMQPRGGGSAPEQVQCVISFAVAVIAAPSGWGQRLGGVRRFAL